MCRWTEQRSDDGAVFFHHRGSGRSSWEHPKDAYFKFLCAQRAAACAHDSFQFQVLEVRQHEEGGQAQQRRAKWEGSANGRHVKTFFDALLKLLVTAHRLWAMEQDGNSSIGSSVTAESISQSLRSGATSVTGASASTASRLTISSFCSSQLELDESRPIPREVPNPATLASLPRDVNLIGSFRRFAFQVQEIAKYLGIPAESLSTPVTPQVAAPRQPMVLLHARSKRVFPGSARHG